jgi:hypothetical protein
MATYEKFEVFSEDLVNGVHHLFGASPTDVLKVYLSNATIDLAANEIKGDVAEITNQNGYTAPIDVTNTGTRSGGTVTVSGVSVQVSASGTVGPFQHVVLYNDTPAGPVDPLIAKWSRTGALTLGAGESFDIKFSDAAVGVAGAIFTLA